MADMAPAGFFAAPPACAAPSASQTAAGVVRDCEAYVFGKEKSYLSELKAAGTGHVGCGVHTPADGARQVSIILPVHRRVDAAAVPRGCCAHLHELLGTGHRRHAAHALRELFPRESGLLGAGRGGLRSDPRPGTSGTTELPRWRPGAGAAVATGIRQSAPAKSAGPRGHSRDAS